MEKMRCFLCDNIYRFSAFLRFFYNFIIHIGNVSDISYFWIEILQQTIQCIKNNDRTGIPDMGTIINGWTANIHTDMIFIQRDEKFFFAC